MRSKPVTRSTGVQCGHTPLFTETIQHMSSIDQSKVEKVARVNQDQHVEMSPWVDIVGWCAVAGGTLWVLKRTYDIASRRVRS